MSEHADQVHPTVSTGLDPHEGTRSERERQEAATVAKVHAEAEAKRRTDAREKTERAETQRLQAKKDEDARLNAIREETSRADQHQQAEAAKEKAQQEEAQRHEAQQRANAEKAEAERVNAERAKSEAARLQVIRDANVRAAVEAAAADARATQERERAASDHLRRAIAAHLRGMEHAGETVAGSDKSDTPQQVMSMSELYDHLEALGRPRTAFNRLALDVELAATLGGIRNAISAKAPDYAEMACAILMHPSLAFRLKE